MSNSSVVTFTVKGMGCGACAAKIEKAVTALAGVSEITFDLAVKQASIHFNAPADATTIAKTIDAAGYETTRLS